MHGLCLIDEQGKFAELSPDEPRKVLRDADGVVTLPKQLWSAFKELGNGEFLCEVGWVLGGGSAVTSRCVLSTDGDVKARIPAIDRSTHRVVQFSSRVSSETNPAQLALVSQEIAAAHERRVSETT